MGTNETRDTPEWSIWSRVVDGDTLAGIWRIEGGLVMHYTGGSEPGFVDELPEGVVRLVPAPTVTVEQIADVLAKHYTLVDDAFMECFCGEHLALEGSPVPPAIPVGQWRLYEHTARAVLALFTNGDK